MRLWRYPQSALRFDVRAAYTNPNYPWIQAVWMWKNYNHWPKQFSIGRMVFPTHVGDVGQHVIHWMWRGYRDCIDVDVLPLSTPVANTSGASTATGASNPRLLAAPPLKDRPSIPATWQAGAGGDKDEPGGLFRIVYSKMLGNHAAHGETNQDRFVNSGMFEHRCQIVGHLAHAIGLKRC